MASKFNQSYFRFLELFNLIADIKPRINLDKVEILLLDHIALALSQNTDLFVKDLITLSTIGSLATLHSRLKSLVVRGYIRLITDDDDNRKKHVVLTVKAQKYYENLSRLIDQKGLIRK
jgi:DNA-binding MarR family transcriptional regulator